MGVGEEILGPIELLTNLSEGSVAAVFLGVS